MDIVSEIQRVLDLEADAISRAARALNSPATAKAYSRAIELMRTALDQGGKVVVTGVGKSGKIGQKISATLCSTGNLSVFLHPTEGLHGDLGLVSNQDVVLALSHSGNTEELLRLIPSLKLLEVPIVGIGGNAESKLAAACAAFLPAPVEQEACPHDLAPTTSTTLMLAIGDALAVTLMQLRGFDRDAFAVTHPAGGIGKRLNQKVGDLMQSGAKIPCLGPDASMEDVIALSTDRKLGAVLITHPDSTLAGIITDGDLRRALKAKEKFFQFRARDVMTATPVTAEPSMLASEALALMENRPFQISVLPVVEHMNGGPKRIVGLLRLHDLLTSL